jgi:hypothetical protein
MIVMANFDDTLSIFFSLSIIVFEIMAKNSKVGHFRGNNSYKGSLYNFIQMKTFDELYLHIISASSICTEVTTLV